MEFDFAHSTPITSLTGIFDGKFHTVISNQNETRQITGFRIELDALLRQWMTQNGKIRAPAGRFCAETRVTLPEDCPGSFRGKNGTIEYATTVKVETITFFLMNILNNSAVQLLQYAKISKKL